MWDLLWKKRHWGSSFSFGGGFLHTVACIIKIIRTASLTTTLKGVYFIYILLPLHVLPLLAIFRRNIQLFQEATLPTTDPLFCVIRSYFYMLGKFCRCLFNVRL
jgi:hypothetical protein